MYNQRESVRLEPIWTNVRPIKLAFLIEENDRRMFEKAIEYNASMWGGIFNLIIPVKNKSLIDDFFYKTLEIHSPDYIICLVDISKDLAEQLEQNVFPLKIENWIEEFKGGTRKITGISINFPGNTILSNEKVKYQNIISYDKCSKYLELILKSFFGNPSVFMIPQPKKENFNYNGFKKYFKYFKSINPTIGPRFNLSPLILTRTDLKILMKSVDSNPRKNIFMIIGKHDSLYDLCLFWNIRSIFCDNPVVFLPYERLIKNLDFIVEELYSMIESSKGSKVIPLMLYYYELDLLSFSISEKKIEKIANAISSHKDFKIPSMSVRKEEKSVKIFTNENKTNMKRILPLYWNISAKRDFKAQIFNNDFSFVEFQAPDYISNSYIGPMFMVDIEFDSFIFPVSNNLSEKLTNWPSRISNGGLSCHINWIPPFPDLKDEEIWHNLYPDKFNNVLVNIPIDFQMIKSIFEDRGFNSRNGFELKPSDKGNFTSEAIKYFDGITKFASFVNNKISLTIINSFILRLNQDAILTKRKNQINNASLSLSEMVKILEKNIPEMQNIKPTNEFKLQVKQLIDFLIERKILRRGFKLKCSTCLNTEWYSIEKVSNKFECNRCGAINTYKSEVEWYYKLNEVIFQGFYHNMTLPILTLNYLSKTCNKFNYVPEIKLIRSKEDWAEVDIACLTDGETVLGECKMNGEINKNEMKKFLKIVEQVKPDKIVFSSFKSFKDGSKKRIKDLQKNEVVRKYNIHVMVLCEKDLYSQV